MSLLRKVWRGEYSLAFTFWVMAFIAPTPFVFAKYYLREAGVFKSENTGIFLAGQVFLWIEWAFFAFITVALWNASSRHLQRAERGGSEKAVWGRLARALAVASGILALGSFANLSGLTMLILGKPLFIGMGGG